LQQEVQVQQEEALLQGQEALLVLEQAQGQVRLLEALVRAQAGVLAQVEAEVLDLAQAVGVSRVAEEQGQDEQAQELVQELVQVQTEGQE
jgi:hypothetical protein